MTALCCPPNRDLWATFLPSHVPDITLGLRALYFQSHRWGRPRHEGLHWSLFSKRLDIHIDQFCSHFTGQSTVLWFPLHCKGAWEMWSNCVSRRKGNGILAPISPAPQGWLHAKGALSWVGLIAKSTLPSQGGAGPSFSSLLSTSDIVELPAASTIERPLERTVPRLHIAVRIGSNGN